MCYALPDTASVGRLSPIITCPPPHPAQLPPYLPPQTEMRTFFRRYFTHSRYISATAQPLDELRLDGPHAATSAMDYSNLYIDLRPYMNR